MKALKFTRSKPKLKESYFELSNEVVQDLALYPDALTLLLVIVSNRDDYFKGKKELFKRLGWSLNDKRKLKNIMAILIQKGYAEKTEDGYNLTNYKKIVTESPAANTQKQEKKINYNFGDLSHIETLPELGGGFNEETDLSFIK